MISLSKGPDFIVSGYHYVMFFLIVNGVWDSAQCPGGGGGGVAGGIFREKK